MRIERRRPWPWPRAPAEGSQSLEAVREPAAIDLRVVFKKGGCGWGWGRADVDVLELMHTGRARDVVDRLGRCEKLGTGHKLAGAAST